MYPLPPQADGERARASRVRKFRKLNAMTLHHAPGITRDSSSESSISQTSSAAATEHNVCYFPPQMDSPARTSTRAMRQSPWWLLLQDTATLISVLPYLPNLFLPFKPSDGEAGISGTFASLVNVIIQIWLFIFEALLLVLAVPLLLVLPFGLFAAVGTVTCVFIYLITWPLEGPRVSYSTTNAETGTKAGQHKSERWLFVNGCATDHSMLQRNIDRLSKTFGREVIGIHNKSYGLPADILECLIQRCFYFKSRDVRVAYAYIKSYIVDSSVQKVVLIGHSQGGIIISLALDQLFASLPSETLSKLEIYTFGSAASHFSNPPLSRDPSHLEPKPSRGVVPHIEHYANELDMIPRWGVLHCVCAILENHYAGSVFVRMGASGHLLNQHYLNPMFPLLPAQQKHGTSTLTDSFLDKTIDPVDDLARRRDSFALSKGEKQVERHGTKLMHSSPPVAYGGIPTRRDAVLIFSPTRSETVVEEEGRERTVRELSRLWRYQGGDTPDDDHDNGDDELGGEDHTLEDE